MSVSSLSASALARWRADPVRFIDEVLRNPETGRPFELLDAERAFLAHAFTTDDTGKLIYPEQIYACPKKSGKSAFGAMYLIIVTLLFGGRFAEGFALANDLEQAQGRVFQSARRIVEASPLLKREAVITQSKIEFTSTGAVIQALTSDYAGVAGTNPNVSVFDELWAYTSERSRRLWDEMVPPPTRRIACRLVVTYAGFSGESALLEELHKRGIAQPQIGTDLYAGDGMLMFWSHQPIAPWQTEAWLAEMRRSLRPNQYLRMIENRFVTSESSFIDMGMWDRCVNPMIGPAKVDRGLPVFVGIDASVKHDSTAIVAVHWDSKAQMCVLAAHHIFQPSPDEPLDFEATIERTLVDWNRYFKIRKCLFDPYQMQATSQRMLRAGIPIEEFPQSSPNLTAASQNLYELIQSQTLICYPDATMRLAVSRAVAIETPRGWRIGKDKQTHKIDVVVALAMAAHAAVTGQAEPYYDLDVLAGTSPDDPNGIDAWRAMRMAAYYGSGGRVKLW
jgi:phage terminase large subunit-like protein